MKSNLVLLCFLLTTMLNAQTIHGKITDKESTEGLPFANVILEKGGQQVAGTTTDLDGKYILVGIDPGTYNIRIVYVGFQDKLIRGISVAKDETVTVDIEMKGEDQVSLSEIVVVEYKVPLLDMSNTSSGSTISGEELRNLPMTNSTSALSKKRKLRQSAYAPTKEQAFQRGIKTTQPVFSVDGAGNGNVLDRTDPGWNNEEYATIKENSFKQSEPDPLSTFSSDVDKAAYSNIRRYLTYGQRPPTDAVRVEEMINYFNYDYPNPKGEHPFSVYTEIGICPWNSDNKLVLIGLKGREIDMSNAPPSNLVFLIDVSGSMIHSNKLPLVKESLKLLVENMRAQDRIALVTYAGREQLALHSTPGNETKKIITAIESLGAGGSTAGGAGIKMAYDIGLKNLMKDGNNRVILATDGDFNVGVSSDNELKKLIEEKRKTGIYLTVLGFGAGNYKDSKMETLADQGNGNYAYIDNLMEAKKVLVNEMSGTLFTIAKDVKIQVEFNPAQVEKYLLIGYENRLLNKEDFNDDKKDAGEIGAGHTVTALYEIVPANSGKQPTDETAQVDPLLYQSNALTPRASQSNEIMQLKLRYKLPEDTTSILLQQPLNLPNEEVSTSENFRFASSVAAFGRLLRKTKHPLKMDIQEIKTLAQSAVGEDRNGYRKEFLRFLDLYKM